MVDAIVTVFLEKLFHILEEESRFLRGYRSQFENLQNELQYLKSFLKDAERLKRKNHTLRATLIDLRELVYEAEDILADCEVNSNDTGKGRDGYTFFMNPLKLPSKYQMGKRLVEINEKVTSIKGKITSYLGPQLLTQSGNGNDEPSRWSSPIYDHTQVVGLEGDTRKLKDWLFQADRGILAVGIVGMGGLGKTTLAQTVFNDREVEHRFEKRIWVSVSQSFTEEQIMRSILRTLGDANTGDDCGELLKRINQYLSGKRFLIVMDDVWKEDSSWWLRIYEGLPKGNGSCVIVTTRNEGVARKMRVQETRIHRPQTLCESDSWLLFCNVAFAANHGLSTSAELESVGKEIVSKCRGLPLAIKAVGGIMLCKPPYYREWRRIADHLRDELAQNDDSVMASLQLSYDELPPYLKSCFLSLSIYPEDCVISKDQLVRWWIGEAFVPVRSNGRLSTEAGEDCFAGLNNRCLVEVVDWDYNGQISTCKVHDMVRDLVTTIAAEDCFAGLSVVSGRHLGIGADLNQKLMERLAKNKKLRALVSTCKSGEVNKISSCIASKFCDFRFLRVLDLSKSIFDEQLAALLSKIGCLKHLACFNLSNSHPLTQLPPSLEEARNLQILDFSYCQSLKSLPKSVMTFEKLAVLDVSHCGSLLCLPKGLCMLSNLQVLLGFKPARAEKDGSRISELRSLTKLRTLGLHITRADEIDDGETDALTGLRQLQVLSISCFNSFEKDLIAKLEKLCPPSNLHELLIKHYPGKVSPWWLNPASLPLLQYLSISGGSLTRLKESFWGSDNANPMLGSGNGPHPRPEVLGGNHFNCHSASWKIEGLKLDTLSYLYLEWETVQRAMLSLRIVHASWCPELRSFPIEGVGFRGGVWKKEDRSG